MEIFIYWCKQFCILILLFWPIEIPVYFSLNGAYKMTFYCLLEVNLIYLCSY